MSRVRVGGYSMVLAATMVVASVAAAQGTIDPQLHHLIDTIRAIDNHSHLRPVIDGPPGAGPQHHPLGESAPFTEERLRASNPQFIAAWQQLYGYRFRDTLHVADALAAKARRMSSRGDGYPAAILDRLRIDIALVNAPSLGRGLVGRRFRWVPLADGFLLPFIQPDPTGIYKLRRTEVGLDSVPPPTLKLFVDSIVRRRMGEWVRAGAVAVKFQIAYYRSLDVQRVAEADASRIYDALMRRETLPARDWKALQDYLFRVVAREAGSNKLPLHIHTGEGGGPVFDTPGSNPMLLEGIFNDFSLSGTTFVLIHGGFPFDRGTPTLVKKQNVYADFSGMSFTMSASELSKTLRLWLETFPQKIMFGTDALDLAESSLRGWEELGWIANRNGRDALALALTSMVADGAISRRRAEEIAVMVMRGNAARLYGFGSSTR